MRTIDFRFALVIFAVTSALSLLGGCSTINRYDDLKVLPFKQAPHVAKNNNAQPSLGIAFGGGGVRGFVHLGVMRALDEAGIRADVVTGASAGAIAASLYASGMTYSEIETAAGAVSEFTLADVEINRQGLLKGQALAEWVDGVTGHRRIREFPIALGITVTDLTNGKALFVVDGDVGEAVQASATVPGAFVPVQSNGITLVDGGILSLVPVRLARDMGADVVVAVDIYCGGHGTSKGTAIDTVMKTFRLQSCLLNKEEASEADFLIRPSFEPDSATSFKQREEAAAVGYSEMKALLPALRKRLGR